MLSASTLRFPFCAVPLQLKRPQMTACHSHVLRLLVLGVLFAAAASFVQHVGSELRGGFAARPGMVARSKEDLGLSKRVLFQKLKRKLEEAAKVPGFLEQETPPEIALFCRGNKDGSQLIACPHTQFIQVDIWE